MSERARILVVDDEPANRRLIGAILASEPYTVQSVASGEEALELISKSGATGGTSSGYDLVLLDVLMPGMDGIETCRTIRQELELPLLPVILVTALADADSRMRGKEAGCDDFLTKPVLEDELLVRIRNLLLLRTYYTLSERERTRAENEARRWKLVSDVAAQVAICRDYEALQQAMLRLLRDQLTIAGSCFFEVVGEELLLMSAQLGEGSEVVWTPEKRPHWSRSRWLSAFERRRVVPVAAAQADAEPFASMLGACGLPAAAALPVWSGGVLDGLFLLASPTPFGAHELTLLDDLAPHLGNAIGNVRSHLKSRELSHARDRMSMLLVHDLKNPLSVVKLNLEALQDPELPEWERDEALRDARSASDQLLGMVLDLLDIARAEEGRLPIVPRMVDIEPFTRDVLSPYRATSKAHDVFLTYRVDAGLRTRMDEKLMRRVLQNLLNNAFRYVAPKGKIDMTVEQEDGWVAFKVSNDGPPIRPDVRKHLFEKYGVVHEGQGASNRGLGLYLCRLVVDGHDGNIRIGDPPGGGVCFEVRIPRE
jgi:signal transduction histidine kinase